MNSQNKPQKPPVREIISTSPLRSVLHLSYCTLTEVWIDGSWVCVKVD